MKEQTKPDLVIVRRECRDYCVAEAIMIDAITHGRPMPEFQFVVNGFAIHNPRLFKDNYHTTIIPYRFRSIASQLLFLHPSFPFVYYRTEEMSSGGGKELHVALTDQNGRRMNHFVIPASVHASSSMTSYIIKDLTEMLCSAPAILRDVIANGVGTDCLAMLKCPVPRIENFRIARHLVLNKHSDEATVSMVDKYLLSVGAETSLTNSEKTYIHRLNEEKD